ncbi:hypothetical protein BDFB_015318, partial [Asbolus verrucosus]
SLENEKYRLVNEEIFPITKSGTKLLSVGVRPLANFEPTLKIYNIQLTS